jgi:hypothetical protein
MVFGELDTGNVCTVTVTVTRDNWSLEDGNTCSLVKKHCLYTW